MPKRIKQRRRGKGSGKYKSPSHKYKGKVEYPPLRKSLEGRIVEIIDDPSRTSPLMEIETEEGRVLLPAPEGVRVGDEVSIGKGEVKKGNVVSLGKIPEGSSVFNIEIKPGDGGKIARAGGVTGKVVAHEEGKVVVKMPSKVEKKFSPKCRATVGRVAGGGRVEKPLSKAGEMFHKAKAKAALWPKTAASAMNPVDHPFGGGDRSPGRRKTVKRNAPPGQKVGAIAAKRAGKKKD